MNVVQGLCEWSQCLYGCGEQLMLDATNEIERQQRELGECSGALEAAGHPIEWQAKIDALTAERDALRDEVRTEQVLSFRSQIHTLEAERDALLAASDALLAASERYRLLYDAVTAMMAPLGYHGTISARDDRVQAVMDALSKLDAARKA